MASTSIISKLALPRGIADGSIELTQSLLMLAMQCDRQFLFSMNLWERPGSGLNTFFGTIGHEILDNYISNAKNPDDEELQFFINSFICQMRSHGELVWLNPNEQAYQETLLLVVFSEYFKYYKDDIKRTILETEETFHTDICGIKFTGKRDLIIKEGKDKILIDHKTAGTISEDEKIYGLGINFQLLLYATSYWFEKKQMLSAVQHNVIRRPTMKPSRNEKLQFFAKRLRAEIQRNPEHFFMRFEHPFTNDMLIEFTEELAAKVERLKELCSGKRKPMKNEAFCTGGFKCPFLEACATNSLKNYTQRNKLSPEL